MYTDEDKSSIQRHVHQGDVREPDNVSTILLAPLRFFESLFSQTLEFMKSITNQLVTLIVCLILVPLVILLSVFAGWFVWKTVAVGWDIPVYLQYGYVPVLLLNIGLFSFIRLETVFRPTQKYICQL
jgi:hypothetical protein